MAIKAPFLPYDKLRERAAAFLLEHNPEGTIPVPIEQIVDLRFEIDIVPIPGLQDAIEADSFISSDLCTISVDQFIYEKRPSRYRFSLAHELAHRLLHQEVFGQLGFSTIGEWKAAVTSIPPQEYSWIETQAYSMAGLMLVPRADLREKFAEMQQIARGAGIVIGEDEEAREVVSSHLGRHFEVSAQVIAKRMRYDKHWD